MALRRVFSSGAVGCGLYSVHRKIALPFRFVPAGTGYSMCCGKIWHNLSDERFSILKNVEHVIAQAAMMIRMHFIALFSLHGF